MAILPTYVFLWYRMRMIYTQPSLKHLNNSTVRFLSYTFILLLLAGGSTACAVAFLQPMNFRISSAGCVNHLEHVVDYTSNYLATGTLVLSQLILFGLFLYPLMIHRQANRESTA